MSKKKPGTKPKPGPRYPSGDLKPQHEGITPALWGRIKNDGARIMGDSRLETQLARLSFAGELTNAQAAAGFRVGEIYRRWHRWKRLRTSPKSANLEQGFSGAADLAEERMSVDQLDAVEAAIKKAEGDFLLLQDELKIYPRNARQAMEDLCVYDCVVNRMIYPDVRILLDKLANFFGHSWRHSGRNAKPRVRVQVNGAAITPKSEAKPRGDPARKAVEVIIRMLAPEISDDGLRDAIGEFIEQRQKHEAIAARETFREQKQTSAARLYTGNQPR